MGFAHSPNTATNGLVLIYDTGNRKSFKGEPTTNLASLDLSDSSVWYNEDSSTTTRELQTETLFGYPVYRFQSKPSQIWVTPFAFNGFDRTAGDVTVSAYIKNTGNSTNVHTYLGGDFSTDSLGNSNYKTIPNDGVWRRYSWTRYSSAMAANQLEFRTSGTGMFISCPQVEYGQHPTPIVQGTRSADSGSLIDLTGNVELDVTNAGFDNTGYLTFDGSNDHITGVLPISGGGEPHTIELVLSPSINQSAFGSRRDPFTIGNASLHEYSALDVNTGNMNWYFYGRDTTFTNNPTLVAGNYYHMVLSYAGGFSNNSNKRVWINGIEQTLSSGHNETPLLPDNPQFSVGRDRGRNTAYFPGDIPIFRVYNRALTEKEALDNFNAIRRRFNI